MNLLYESLFRNDDVYALLYRDIDQRRWTILNAAPGHAFVKPDNGIVSGNIRGLGSLLLYASSSCPAV
jgi:hypothetical protein